MQGEREPGTLGAEKLREMASWYREFAKRAVDPGIRESRLRMAEDLDEEADEMIPSIEQGAATV